jgi:hypothetical protein
MPRSRLARINGAAIAAVLLAVAAIAADPAAGSRHQLTVTRSAEAGLPADATEADAKKYLADIRRPLEAEMDRVRSEARSRGTAKSDPSLVQEAARQAETVIASHLDLVCRTTVAADGDQPPMYFSALQMALLQHRDYAPEDKAVILRYLPKLPALIRVVDQMNWYEGADEAIAAGWKKARSDERDGMLNPNASFYAVAAAKHGVVDALVAIARTVRKPDAGIGRRKNLFEKEGAALKALVPNGGDAPVALADYVLKNKAKLIFDPAKSVYVVRS